MNTVQPTVWPARGSEDELAITQIRSELRKASDAIYFSTTLDTLEEALFSLDSARIILDKIIRAKAAEKARKAKVAA